MNSGFRAMLGVAAGTFLIVVLAVAGAALAVAAFTGVQGPWPEGPVAQALALFSRNGTLAVIAVILLIIIGCLPGVGPRSWVRLNPIVRSTGGVRGISFSEWLDISVARAIGFAGAVAVVIWAAPYASLEGPATTGPVADLPAPAGIVTALAALVLLALPYGVAGLFSLRTQSEFVDDYRIRPYDRDALGDDDWRHLRDREADARRDRRDASSATPMVEPLFPPGSLPSGGSRDQAATPSTPLAGNGGAAAAGPATTPAPPSPSSATTEPAASTSSTLVLVGEPAGTPDEPVLVFTVAAQATDPVMVFSPASGVEPRVWVAPPTRRPRPAYTPASRIKADDLLSPPVLFPQRPLALTAGPAAAGAKDVEAVPSPAGEVAVPKKKKKKKGKKGGATPVNVTVHVHMPPPA